MNRHFTIWKLLPALVGLCLVLHGCAVPSHEQAVSSIKTGKVNNEKIPDSFSSQAESGAVDDDWLKNFNDPKLNSLVAEALHKNPGLKIKEAQVEGARAYVQQARAKLKPTVQLGGSARDTEYKGINEKSNIGLSVSWEPDVWGRIRTGVAAAKEGARASEEDYQFARQSLVASVADGWFTAITAKEQHRFAREIVDLQKKNLKITQARQQIGQGGERDVHLAKGALASAQKAEQGTLAAYKASLRSLELLLGRYPSADLETEDHLVAVPPPIPAGIPSQILERRPDLVAAEEDVAKAFYKEKATKLLNLPRFTFTAGIGVNSLNDAISGLAAGIFAPLYTGGAIKAMVKEATAEQKAAIASYAQKALQAFKEVETALTMETTLANEEKDLKTVVKENKIAYVQTKKQYQIGEGTMIDVLTIQQQWIASKIAALDIASRRLINRVQLHLALGGSFDSSPAVGDGQEQQDKTAQ